MCRWHIATAVVFPQKSESFSRCQKEKPRVGVVFLFNSKMLSDDTRFDSNGNFVGRDGVNGLGIRRIIAKGDDKRAVGKDILP